MLKSNRGTTFLTNFRIFADLMSTFIVRFRLREGQIIATYTLSSSAVMQRDGTASGLSVPVRRGGGLRSGIIDPQERITVHSGVLARTGSEKPRLPKSSGLFV